MKRICLSLLISFCLIATSAPQGLCKGAPPSKPTAVQVPARDDRKAEQIKAKLRNLGIASRVTVILNNGNDRYGSIERLDDDSFQIAEVDMKQIFTVAYSDVKKVREGYGNPNQFTGKRWNPIWAKISLIAVVVMFAVVIPVAAANDR